MSKSVVLVLQGGGALGSYQAGVFEALVSHQLQPDWLAGISIGAINAALIAGNRPEMREKRLRHFWEHATSNTQTIPFMPGVVPRGAYNSFNAMATTLLGVPGFFSLRNPSAAFMPPGTQHASSYYDTAPLKKTLLELVDFEYLNSGAVRLSVGAVNVATGNLRFFDTNKETLGPEHIMASGALPPGFPSVEIDGDFYWDGGLVSNTPLQYVIDENSEGANLDIFQVDLFNARGAVPDSVWEVEAREKDIRFSSRTRFNTDMMERIHDLHESARRLYARLPKELQDDEDVRALIGGKDEHSIAIAHLIYRQADYEQASKDYEFSRSSMQDHWRAGRVDGLRTLNHADWQGRFDTSGGTRIFDLAQENPTTTHDEH